MTPLLDDEHVVGALRRAVAPMLLVGGTADETWRPEVGANLEAEVLEIDGADHSLEIRGSPLASIDVLRATTERIDAFVARLAR